MKILCICLAVFSLSQGFPRPSSNNDNTGDRRQEVYYGYPESSSEPYASNQVTAYSSDPADTNLDNTYPHWSELAQSTTAEKRSSPAYLSLTMTANVGDSNNPDDEKKSPKFNKGTFVDGNHAVTYLELPKHLHKPAIVRYQVQIAPKTKGVPLEQEIAIMPPEGAGGERKPLVHLKQVVSKSTDERIQVIIPKSESSSLNAPKVEMEGGHVDQEALNSQGEGRGQEQGQGQTQDQIQSRDQSQGHHQDQSQSQDQYQAQGQLQGQSQYQGHENENFKNFFPQ